MPRKIKSKQIFRNFIIFNFNTYQATFFCLLNRYNLYLFYLKDAHTKLHVRSIAHYFIAVKYINIILKIHLLKLLKNYKIERYLHFKINYL